MTTLTKNNTLYSQAIDLLKNTQQLPADLISIKQEAMEQFEQLGLPTMKNEEWKYTYLGKVLKRGFVPGLNALPNAKTQQAIANILPEVSKDINRIVLVDGMFSAELSQINSSDQFKISSITDSWVEEQSKTSKLFSTLTHGREQALTALNTALFQDGIYIEVPDGARAHFEIMMVKTGKLEISMPRLLIHVGAEAYLNIAEQNFLLEGESFSNIVSEVFMEKSSKVEWVSVQDANDSAYIFDSIYVHQAEKSQYHSTVISLTGAIMRNNQYIKITGEEAHADLGGVYILNGEQQADNLILIEHESPNCTSNQLFKGILDDKSVGVFNGKIVVVPEAQKTDAFQSNKNILLSKDASAYFRPQLEIYADDVRCSHGATSSDIEDHELFYLRSRGIGKDLAKSLLIYAFVGDVIEEIENESLREWVKSRVASKLKIEL
ncbi:MAG TPA: Fe-S cluster assembly protein SufD [Chitinophagales bacterium]|nr:Fe-S cluster assembly protein SufD [Chitinophagales bacterium]